MAVAAAADVFILRMDYGTDDSAGDLVRFGAISFSRSAMARPCRDSVLASDDRKRAWSYRRLDLRASLHAWSLFVTNPHRCIGLGSGFCAATISPEV